MTEVKNENPETETPEVLKAKIAKLEADNASMTGELTGNRPKLREADEKIVLLQEQLKAASEKNNSNPEEDKIREAVAKVLSEKEVIKSKDNKKAAFDKFVSANKDYHPENDPTGLKRAALEKEYDTFNSSGVTETEDFMTLIEKANTYLRGTDTARQNNNQYSSTPSSATPPKETLSSKLSEPEAKLIQRNGWTEEKFLGLKAKMPAFIEDLVAQVR